LVLSAAGASAFLTPQPLSSSAPGRLSALKSLKCSAVPEVNRREALKFAAASAFALGPMKVLAADEAVAEEEVVEEVAKPGSVPREVTYEVKDDVCDKHPTWKQCRKKAKAPSKAEVVTLESGLKVQDVMPGKGITPQQGDTVTVHYSLFYKGDEIESSRESQGLAAQPLGFQFGVKSGYGSVIPALSLGIDGMKVGGIRRVQAPPNMAFGDKGKGSRIPPGAQVEFDIQLLSCKRAGTNPITSQGRGAEKNVAMFDLF